MDARPKTRTGNPPIRIPVEFSSPARRYEFAVRAARQGRALLPSDGDELTGALANYLAREQTCRTPAERQALAARRPVLASVLAIHRERSRAMASLLEALLLAREPTTRVAGDSGLPPEVVAAYRSCFLALGERLDDQHYVLNNVIRPELSRGDPATASHRTALKFFGYFSGRAALDALFAVGANAPLDVWRPIPELVEKMLLTRDLAAVAGLATAGVSVPAEPAQLTDWLAGLTTRLAAAEFPSTPRNVFARSAANTFANVHELMAAEMQKRTAAASPARAAP